MSNKPLTVSRAWVASMLAFAERQGVDVDAICRELELNVRDGAPNRLPMDTVVLLWRRCASASGDPLFGLNFGRQVRPGTFQVVGYTLMSCATLGEALDKLGRYQRLVSEGGRISFEVGPSACQLYYAPQPETLEFIDHQIDAVMAAIMSFTRWLTGRKLRPISVALQHQPGDDSGVYSDYFGCEVEFGATFNTMELPAACLEWPLVDADPDLKQLHEGKAEEDLAKIGDALSVSAQTAHLLRVTGQPLALSRQRVAEALGISERTMQRRLQSERTQYRILVEKVASELACRWLAQSGASLQSVAEELGFSDASAFHRAFLRWKGISPGEWRRISRMAEQTDE